MEDFDYKMAEELSAQNPLSSSYRIGATMVRELQNEGPDAFSPMLGRLK